MSSLWSSSAAVAKKRYERLALTDALQRTYDYPAACEELSAILRISYSKLPKDLQSRVFNDTISAFRRLPQVQTSYGMSSATILFQAADATFSQQRRKLASSEFKHAAVAHKRHYKTHHDGGSAQLPQDVILLIFGFLDMRTLATASLVCWAWNSAASDNMLWRSQYSLLFGKYRGGGCKEQTDEQHRDKNVTVPHQNIENADPMPGVSWREAFKTKYMGDPSWKFTSKRVFCRHCASIIWLSSMTSDTADHCPNRGTEKCKIKPLSPDVVASYLIGHISLKGWFSYGDSDSEEGSTIGFWLYPSYSSDSDY